jgi:hypothetical protein
MLEEKVSNLGGLAILVISLVNLKGLLAFTKGAYPSPKASMIVDGKAIS